MNKVKICVNTQRKFLKIIVTLTLTGFQTLSGLGVF